MALQDLKRCTVLMLVMAGLYIAVFVNNLTVFFVEILCLGAWSGWRALPWFRRKV